MLYVLPKEDGTCDVLDNGKVIESFPSRDAAEQGLKRLNAKKGHDAIYSTFTQPVTQRDLRDGCTCNRGVMLPGQTPCPVHG